MITDAISSTSPAGAMAATGWILLTPALGLVIAGFAAMFPIGGEGNRTVGIRLLCISGALGAVVLGSFIASVWMQVQ